jgi:hypothetical protein
MQRRDERGQDRHSQRYGDDDYDREDGQRWRIGGPEETGAGTGEQRSGQPADEQAGGGRHEGQDQVLGEKHPGD